MSNKIQSPIIRMLLAGGIFILLCWAILGTGLFWIYGTETNHTSRDTIWWSERGRSLIPPEATNITLQQDFLDHYATYTITERDLNQFLNTRFADDGEVLDSFKERSHVSESEIGQSIGRLGWTITSSTVIYSYCASNGGVHSYYHDPETGQTYQSSAYW